MNCVNCYHYRACASVDVTGYVTDLERDSEETCEHFLNPEDVRRTAHWARDVHSYSWSDQVRVRYICSRCGAECETTYSSDFIYKSYWYDYQREHWMPRCNLPHFCHGCGAEMDLNQTDHTNVETVD